MALVVRTPLTHCPPRQSEMTPVSTLMDGTTSSVDRVHAPPPCGTPPPTPALLAEPTKNRLLGATHTYAPDGCLVAVVPPWPRTTVMVVPLTDSTPNSSLSMYRETVPPVYGVSVGARMPVAEVTTICCCFSLVTAADSVVGTSTVPWPNASGAATANRPARETMSFFMCRFPWWVGSV